MRAGPRRSRDGAEPRQSGPATRCAPPRRGAQPAAFVANVRAVRVGTRWIHAASVAVLALTSCTTCNGDVRSYVLRLRPGAEVRRGLVDFARREGIRAGCVVSAVGSLTRVASRYANRQETTALDGHFELVALSGHLSADTFHLHMAAGDGDGRTVGGHVMEGNVVYTTLVIVIEDRLRWNFRQEVDPTLGYVELAPESRTR